MKGMAFNREEREEGEEREVKKTHSL